MQIGVFLPMEPAGRSAAEQYAHVLDVAQMAEELGYSSLWIASRHLSPDYASVPSPLVLLAAVASRTSSIALGTSVVTLPLENTVRLVEDFAVCDALSVGRTRLGIGSGDDEPAFKAMGIDFDNRQEINSTQLPALLDILDSGSVGGLPLHPSVEAGRSKVYLAAQSGRGAAWAGSLGVGLLQGRSEPKAYEPTASQTRAAEAYRLQNPNGRVVTARNVWVGSPDDALFDEALARYDAYLRSRGREPLPQEKKEAIRKLNVVFGEADAVAKELRARVAPIAPDELLITVDPGGLPAGEVEKRVTAMAQAFGL